ncbi:MAG TPA: response regulator transcription factor [Anaerolineae bacterium]
MIRVIIADDHAIVRQGVKQILSETTDVTVAGEAADAFDVKSKLSALPCDVLVLDLSMPGLSGFDLLKDVRHERPALPVLVLSMHPEDQYGMRMLKAGASGYLNKECVPDQLVTAIRQIAGGGHYISPNLAAIMADHLYEPSETPAHATLSDREFQVMYMIAQGKTVSEIAANLSLSVKTVSTYRTRILVKMGLHTNTDIVHYAISNRLVV